MVKGLAWENTMNTYHLISASTIWMVATNEHVQYGMWYQPYDIVSNACHEPNYEDIL